MIEKALLVILILVFPGLVIYFKSRSKIKQWLCPIVACYLASIIIVNFHGISFIVKNEL